MHKCHQKEHFKIWSLKSKAVTKLFERLLIRRVELWNNRGIITDPVAVRTAVKRKIWSKLLRKTIVEKLVNKCFCFKY